MKDAFITLGVDETTSYDKEGLGTVKVSQDGKRFRWVQNKTGAVTVIGDVLTFGTSDPTKNSVYQLGQSSVGTNANFGLGVCMSAMAIDGYGWVQTLGICDVANVKGDGTNVVAGDNLKITTGTSKLVKDTASGTAPTLRRGAVSWAAVTTDTTARVELC